MQFDTVNCNSSKMQKLFILKTFFNMEHLHFTVSEILEDFTKQCGAAVIIIVIAKSVKKSLMLLLRSISVFHHLSTNTTSLLEFLHDFDINAMYYIRQRHSILGSALTLIPGGDVC